MGFLPRFNPFSVSGAAIPAQEPPEYGAIQEGEVNFGSPGVTPGVTPAFIQDIRNSYTQPGSPSRAAMAAAGETVRTKSAEPMGPPDPTYWPPEGQLAADVLRRGPQTRAASNFEPPGYRPGQATMADDLYRLANERAFQATQRDPQVDALRGAQLDARFMQAQAQSKQAEQQMKLFGMSPVEAAQVDALRKQRDNPTMAAYNYGVQERARLEKALEEAALVPDPEKRKALQLDIQGRIDRLIQFIGLFGEQRRPEFELGGSVGGGLPAGPPGS